MVEVASSSLAGGSTWILYLTLLVGAAYPIGTIRRGMRIFPGCIGKRPDLEEGIADRPENGFAVPFCFVSICLPSSTLATADSA